MKLSKKTIGFVALIVIILGALLIHNYYQKIFGESITKDKILFVYASDSMMDVKNKIEKYSTYPNMFLWIAARKNVSQPKNGRYQIKKGMSNNDLVNMLRSGNQTPLKIAFNNQDNIQKAAGRIASQIEADSISILQSFLEDSFLKSHKLTEKSVLQILLPNTYEVYWTIKPEAFRDRMLKEYNRFWNKSRVKKASALNLTKNEVITLASIVQKETAKSEERPIVAGLYLNRLKKGWPLQADPTVIFAVKEKMGQDYVIKRVLNKDLKLESPYNTYLNKGLPPTQIGMPDISAIDAVLNFTQHNYYYMCASIDNIGYHKFAKTLRQHNKNAAEYQKWLNTKGVKR